MSHIFCLKTGGFPGLQGLWHFLSDMIQDKSTEVPRTCIFRYDSPPHCIGDLSDVYRCTMISKSHGKIEVAVKSLRILDLSEEAIKALRKRIYREVRAWTTLHHKNIHRFFGTTSGFGPLPAFVTPWMERGSLTDYLSLEFFNLLQIDKFILLEQVTTAIQYLHDKHVIHGNLAGHNILIDSRGNAYVTDFGLSTILAECNSSSCEAYYPGSIRWAAPELIDLADEEAEKPTTCSDVYSLGSVALQVLSGKLPYHWLEDPLHIMAARHKGMEPMAADSSMDRQHIPFLQECWSRPSARPTIDHVLCYIRSVLPP
ncbi:kinase-like domain-containing protein [Suillus clintonianus]|uniref:kinase-like domain-containing protein n=1 Tax=Suillus clintonianus TaxID=1904413 RepID=UPI001B8834FC|nr:kinase-like domain-containing protein [Suillus clintonianus]KAG2126831.1 kinase-like domain-containing protein [Suillus clintonianus]